MAAEQAAPLRAVIVDDEPLAVERLAMLCARDPGVELVGSATDGRAGLELVEALKPDLLLLDIAMPELDGMGVARALAERTEAPPAIIFVTAFDGFAVEAFDVAAIDYLLKPVAPDRLRRAVARVAAATRTGEAVQLSPHAREFWVPHRSELVRVAANDIDRIDAERDYMRLHVGPRSFLLHQTIGALEARLDPARFIRLHRSTIIRRDRIAGLRHDGGGVWSAVLTDGGAIRIGRTFLTQVKEMAGR